MDIEDLLVDLYYYLEKSTVRHQDLKKCQVLCDVTTRKILKHVNTRWLSLGKCVDRLLEQWSPLEKFVDEHMPKPKAESTKTSSKKSKTQATSLHKKTIPEKSKAASVEPKTRIERIQARFLDPTTKLYCLFLKAVIPVFNSVNMLLQREEPCIHVLKDELMRVLTELYIRFLTPASIAECEDLLCIDYKNRKCQKDRHDLVIGAATKQYIATHKLSHVQKDTFYKAVRQYFCRACDYIILKFPLKSDVLEHAKVANIGKRAEMNFESVLFFMDRFPALNADSDAVQLEFLRFQVESLPDNVLLCERADVAWHLISQLRYGDGKPKFLKLASVIMGILVIPHSNASSERVFSCVRKNRTEFRPNLSESTLECLLVEKTSMFASGDVPCYKQKYSNQLIRKAKSATYNSLKTSATQGGKQSLENET